MVRTNFYYPEQMLSELKKYSKQTGIAVSEHIRRAITAYLEKIEILKGQSRDGEPADININPQ